MSQTAKYATPELDDFTCSPSFEEREEPEFENLSNEEFTRLTRSLGIAGGLDPVQ